MAKTVKLSDEVLSILRASTIAGNVLTLPAGQLERGVYERVDKALKAAGGKWDRRAGGHVFTFDPSELLGDALDSGSIENRQQSLQFFETPTALVERMLSILQSVAVILPESRALEPSAGHGRIALPLARIYSEVVAVEIDPDNASILRTRAQTAALPVKVIEGDFIEQAVNWMDSFDAVVMNPPFSGGQAMQHIRAAYDLLNPRGWLVAICEEGAFFRKDLATQAFQSWLSDNDAEDETLDRDTFKESGTGVATRLLYVQHS